MKKIMLFQVENPMQVKMAVATMHLRVETVAVDNYNQKIADIVNGTLKDNVVPAHDLLNGSLLLMCDLNDAEVDHVLSRLRSKKVSVTHKCMLTPTNQTWDAYQLYDEMEKEQQMYLQMERMQE